MIVIDHNSEKAELLINRSIEPIIKHLGNENLLPAVAVKGADWCIDLLKITSTSKSKNKHVYTVSGVRHISGDMWESISFYAVEEIVEKMSASAAGLIEPIYVVYTATGKGKQNFISDVFTKDEAENYKGICVTSKTWELYEKLVMISCLSDEARHILRMRFGIEPLVTKRGEITFQDDLDDFSLDSKLVFEMCRPITPRYVLKEMKKNEKKMKNSRISSTRKSILEMRSNYLKAVPWGLPIKEFEIKKCMTDFSSEMYGRENEKRRALQYIYSKRRNLFGQQISDKNDDDDEIYDPAILIISGRNGNGKELFARSLSKIVSNTYADFDLNSFGKDVQELKGSSVIYDNSERGEMAKITERIGDRGCVSILNYGEAPDNFKAAANDIMLHGLRDNNLEFRVDIAKTIFIILVRDISEVPTTLQDNACIINFEKYTKEERLEIGKKYIFPQVCEKLYIDKNMISISDELFELMCNGFVSISSLDQITSNFQTVLQAICSEYENELNSGKVFELTEDYIVSKLFKSDYKAYITEESLLAEKFRFYRRFYSLDDQKKIESMFERIYMTTDDHEKQKIKDSIVFFVNYLPEMTKEDIDIEMVKKNFKKYMDSQLFGHEEAKAAIIDAIIGNLLKGRNVCGNLRILLAGPAGTGKTELANVVAKLLNTDLIKISLNGMKDPQIIKGFSKTFEGSKMGILADKLAQGGSCRKVVLLDEIEKASGEVLNTLFDIMDPSTGFYNDDFLEEKVNKAGIAFIATGNDLSNVPYPLLDRFTVINVSGYSYKEKLCIAKDYIIPKILKRNHLDKCIVFTKDTIEFIIKNYVHTSSVREMEKLFEKMAIRFVSSNRSIAKNKRTKITMNMVKEILGVPHIKGGNIPLGNYKPGTVNCLAVRGDGSGSVFPVEVVKSPYLKERSITGQCGDMILDSIKMADVIVSNLLQRELCNTAITLSEQAIPKDGPSAGITIVMSMLSAHLEMEIPRTVAMTGEIDIHANIFPVGGLKGKLSAALNEGVKKVFIPADNYDYMEKTGELDEFSELEIIPVNHVNQVVEDLFGDIEELRKKKYK